MNRYNVNREERGERERTIDTKIETCDHCKLCTTALLT